MTGWPPGLLQDDCRGLSIWLSTRIDSRRHAREAGLAITSALANAWPFPKSPPPPYTEPRGYVKYPSDAEEAPI